MNKDSRTYMERKPIIFHVQLGPMFPYIRELCTAFCSTLLKHKKKSVSSKAD